MKEELSCGLFDWRRKGQYGLIKDLSDGASIFCHISKNPRLDEFGLRQLLVYERRTDNRSGKSEALGLRSFGQLNADDVLKFFKNDVLKLLKSKWADAVLMDVSSTTASSLVRKYLAQVGLLKDGVQFAELCRLLKAVGVGVGLNVLDVKREVVPLVDDRSAFTLWLDGYYETIDGDILLEQFRLN
ncbi:MAG: hypothetical protein IPP26_11225 [Flavobacteriales bacterium]|nr:hypothetical protein [Flavobacteriales bacterium]